jgi:hypothetical protein
LSADVVSQWAPRLSKLFEWGTRDGRVLEAWDPRLTFLEQTSAIAGYDKIPLRPQRAVFRLLHAVPVIRDYDRLYRFRW